MLDERRSIKVFLCHAQSDKNAVHDLFLLLKMDGVDAWLAAESLLPGQDLEYEIRRAVRESDIVVVCLSKQFNQAGFWQREVRLALDTAMEKPEGEIFLIPARLEECDIPDSLRKWQRVDLFERGGHYRLMQAIAERGSRIGAQLQASEPGSKKLTEVEILQSQAIRDELLGDFWNALQAYYRIKRIDPDFPRVDIKIKQLEREIPEPIPVKTLRRPALSWLSCLIVSLVGIAILLFVAYRVFYGATTPTEPTPTPTNALASIQPTSTGTPCPDEPADVNLDFGQVVTHAICPAGDTDTFRFSGTSGDRVRIQVTYKSGTLRPCIELVAPDNTRTVACELGFENVIDQTLDQTGTYTIVADVWFAGTTGSYTIVVERL